jgi:hypothetical protein
MIPPRLAGALALPLAAVALTGCGAAKRTTSTQSRAATTTAPAPVAIAPGEGPACAALFARLQRVTIALQTSSDLIAHSLTRTQLGRRIAIEQVQLQRSAALMAGVPAPAALVPAERSLIAALRSFSRDFGRAKTAARRGDFRTATGAMTDPTVVQRILAASKTIEHTCSLH